jgi:hypothetical protein
VVVYFLTATKCRSRGASWSIIAPPFILPLVNSLVVQFRGNYRLTRRDYSGVPRGCVHIGEVSMLGRSRTDHSVRGGARGDASGPVWILTFTTRMGPARRGTLERVGVHQNSAGLIRWQGGCYRAVIQFNRESNWKLEKNKKLANAGFNRPYYSCDDAVVSDAGGAADRRKPEPNKVVLF